MLTFAWISGLVLACLYARNIWNYVRLNRRIEEESSVVDLPHVTVIIPFRNEASNLQERIRSLENQNYPKDRYQVILINDHSSDDFQKHVNNLKENFSFLSLPEKSEGKIEALNAAINHTDTQWIICSDADCTAGESWLLSFFEREIPAHVVACCGPVRIASAGSPLQELQFLDMIGVMGMTSAGHRGLDFAMANGANLAFRRKSFYEVGGFEGSEKWSAADDMWLISQFSMLHKGSVGFNDRVEAEVITNPELSWKGFFQQRIRWAGKTSAYTNKNILYHIGLAFGFSVFIVLLGLLALIDSSFLSAFVVFMICRSIIDFMYLTIMTKKYGQKIKRGSYLLVQCLHIIYIVGAGILAMRAKRYTWKDRILS